MKKLFLILSLFLLFFIQGCTKQIRDEIKIDSTNSKNQTIKTEKIEIRTADNITLSANYYYLDKNVEKNEPLIILIHQFRSDKKQWSLDFIKKIVDNGYKVIAYDIRGHGKSDKINIELSKLLSDKNQAPTDLDAVINWAHDIKGIDSSRIGIIGTSIGASLGIYARVSGKAKSVVAISGGKGTFEAFTGYDERMMSMGRPIPRITNIMYICGKQDGSYADEEKSIFENFLGEPRELLLYESELHGKDLINKFPEIEDKSINWLKSTL